MIQFGLGCLVALLAACGGSKKPAPQQPATTDLHVDVVTFCSAEAAAHVAGGLPELGPFLEPKLHETEVKTLLLGLEAGTTSVAEAKARIDALVTAEHVEACPTRDQLFAPAPA